MEQQNVYQSNLFIRMQVKSFEENDTLRIEAEFYRVLDRHNNSYISVNIKINIKSKILNMMI